MPALDVRDLKISFFTRHGEARVVRGVSFSLEAGETLGIVGESGSGKSVTALSLLRLLAPGGRVTGGEALFGGVDLLRAPLPVIRDIRGKRVSMIFQDPMSSLNPLMPIGKQIAEAVSIHQRLGGGALRRRVLELLEAVRIPEPERRCQSYPHEFSGGMRQRAMIALALACGPEIVIADEPTTALDVTIQKQILLLLKNLQAEMGMAIIFITHDLGVVAEICSRVVVMYGGLIMEESPVTALFERPAHPYTLGLLRSLPRPDQDRAEKLESIPGSPPDMLRPPPGCPFAPRCAFALKLCGKALPDFYPAGGSGTGRVSRCWLRDRRAPAAGNPFKGASHG